LATVQTYHQFRKAHVKRYGTSEGSEKEYLKYQEERSDEINANWHLIDIRAGAVDSIFWGTMAGVGLTFAPGATAAFGAGWGTEKGLKAAGVDAYTAATIGRIVGLGTGSVLDPAGTLGLLTVGWGTEQLLRGAGVNGQDAAIFGSIAGGLAGGLISSRQVAPSVRSYLSAQRVARAQYDGPRLAAQAAEFEMSKGARIAEGLTLFKSIPQQARVARPGAYAPPLLDASAPPAWVSGGVPPVAGRDYYAPGAVVSYEARPLHMLDRLEMAGYEPRSSLVANISDGSGGFTGGTISAATPSTVVRAMAPVQAPALPLVGQRLLSAGRIRGKVNSIPPSDPIIALGPGSLGYSQFGSKVFRNRVRAYVEAVNSNRPWSWDEIGLGFLNHAGKAVVSKSALDAGFLPRIPVDRGTRHADFSRVVIEERVLPEHLWHLTDDVQFRYLDNLIGGRPAGTTWHHHELPGWMQLVPFGAHSITWHFGGRSPGGWAWVDP
jgi:hypothetical protein